MPVLAGDDRRRYVRVEVNLGINLRNLTKKDGDSAVDGPALNFVEARNISAGGIQLVSREEIKLSDRVLLAINIPGHGELTIKSHVVYMHTGKNQKGQQIYLYGLKFYSLPDDARAALLCYVLENQLKRKNRLR